MITATRPKTEELLQFNADDLAELASHGKEKHFEKGQPMWAAGDTPEAVYLVKNGRANMAIPTLEGAPAIVHFCTATQMFCPSAAVTGSAYPCSAVAATDLTVIAVPRSAFLSLFNRLPHFARGLIQQMAPLMCESHARQAMAAAPVKARLARLLCGLHHQYHGASLPFTRQELASMSATTVETTIRTLSEWEKGGTIQSQRGSIRVMRLMELEDAAC